jgi:hypothetical protein
LGASDIVRSQKRPGGGRQHESSNREFKAHPYRRLYECYNALKAFAAVHGVHESDYPPECNMTIEDRQRAEQAAAKPPRVRRAPPDERHDEPEAAKHFQGEGIRFRIIGKKKP